MKHICLILLATAMLFTAPVANAKSSYMTSFGNAYPDANGSRIDNCLLCHANANPSSNSSLNAYGAAWKSAGDSFTAIENQDSDGDAFSNLSEIENFTYPGDAADIPVIVEGEGEIIEGEGEVIEGEGEGEPETTADIAAYLVEQFINVDSNGDERLDFGEVLATLPGVERSQFDEIDANGNGYLSLKELQAFLDGRCGCFGDCRKGYYPVVNVKGLLGDWLLVGLSLLLLISLANKQKR